MQIAARAFDQLEPSVRTKVGLLLKLNPDYAAWTQGVVRADKYRYAFIRAATWADDIKERPDYIKVGDLPSAPDAARNIGYADRLVHGYWHFVDFPFSSDGTPLRQPEPPNALSQIRLLSSALRSSSSDGIRSYDLVWLIHLVGDAHQPLHATSRFTRQFPTGDSGGNAEKVCMSLNCSLKLHAFWDGLLGDRGTPADAIAAANQLPVPDCGLAAVADPQAWVEESFAIAQQSVYTSAVADGRGPFMLDQSYQAAAIQIAKARAALAAARLANLLNSALR
jgi:hypothetical protein